MAVYRYGSVHGKPETRRMCRNKKCGKEFDHKLDRAEYCSSECYRDMPEQKKKAYQAVKRHRDNNREKFEKAL